MKSFDEFRTALARLNHKKCWSVIAGAGTGPTLHMSFGAQIPRQSLVPNRRLTPVEQAYEGELDLFIECAWRLEQGSRVLCGSTDDDRNDGRLVMGVRQMVDKTVHTVTARQPVPDLQVQFSDDLCLLIFCDQTNTAKDQDNYSLRLGETILAVDPHGQIVLERRRTQ